MNKKYDLTGKKFEKLTVLKRVENSKCGQTRWLCKCECGNETIVWGNHLRSGHTRSCGCINKEVCANLPHKAKHGLHGTRLYRIWNGIKNRTRESTNWNPLYKNYSGRGIDLCEDWNEFISFYNWAIKNGYDDNLTIDRIDVNGNYEPKNCRWVTMKEQQNNKRDNVRIEYMGECHTLSEWEEKLGMNRGLLRNRLYRGWSIERALNYGRY